MTNDIDRPLEDDEVEIIGALADTMARSLKAAEDGNARQARLELRDAVQAMADAIDSELVLKNMRLKVAVRYLSARLKSLVEAVEAAGWRPDEPDTKRHLAATLAYVKRPLPQEFGVKE